ncbi:MAG: hypothetical protein AAGA87_09320 [Pseudomonadota bacterium]
MTSVTDRSYVHVAAGFLLMGIWAAFANRAHAMPAPLIAGLVQGTLTAGITLGLKHMLEALNRRLPGLSGLLIPPLLAGLASVALLSTIHTLAATPEVLRTLAVPTTVATLYAAAYTWRLWSRTHG